MKVMTHSCCPFTIKGGITQIEYFRIEDSAGNAIFSIGYDGIHASVDGNWRLLNANDDMTKIFTASIIAMTMKYSFINEHYYSEKLSSQEQKVVKELLKSALLLLD